MLMLYTTHPRDISSSMAQRKEIPTAAPIFEVEESNCGTVDTVTCNRADIFINGARGCDRGVARGGPRPPPRLGVKFFFSYTHNKLVFTG